MVFIVISLFLPAVERGLQDSAGKGVCFTDSGRERTAVGCPYSEGHIPGTININVLDDSFSAMADSTLQKDKPVALYCRSGKRSKKAAAILSEKGYKVYELDKGFNAWQEAGEKVEK